MQAIGFLSRREHSRQELRAKLLDSLRKRAREDAALAAAEELARVAQAQPSNGIDDAFAPRAPVPAPVAPRARASRAGAPARGRLVARGRERDPAHDLGEVGEPEDDEIAGVPRGASPERPSGRASPSRALDTLVLATGAALPSRLRASLEAVARVSPSLAATPTSVATAAQRSAAGAANAADAEDAGDAMDAVDAVDPANEDAPGREAPDDIDLERTDPEAAVDQLLDWLVANKYLSDARFVESRVNARSRKQGTLRIKLELSRHGLALEPEQAAALRETEFARARALWQRKFGEVATDPKQRAKQARFLAARGFAADVVRRVVGGEEEF